MPYNFLIHVDTDAHNYSQDSYLSNSTSQQMLAGGGGVWGVQQTRFFSDFSNTCSQPESSAMSSPWSLLVLIVMAPMMTKGQAQKGKKAFH